MIWIVEYIEFMISSPRTHVRAIYAKAPVVGVTVIGFTLFLFSYSLIAETYQEPRHKQLGMAYGYIFGQAFTLNRIKDEFPDLKPQVALAEATFGTSPYGDALSGIQGEFEEIMTVRFPEENSGDVFSKLEEGIKKPLRDQAISYPQAKAFVNEVLSRAKGEIQPDVRSVLLSASRKYKKYPSKEITEGLVTRFVSEGHPKAKRRKFSISIPYSWSSREGVRPNIIQVFQNGAGHGPLQCILSVKQIPALSGATTDDLKAVIEEEDLSELLPDGASLIRSDRVSLDGLPAREIVANLQTERVGVKVSTRTIQYITFEGSQIFLIQFMLAESDESASGLDDLESKYLSLIKSIAASFAVLDKY